ncbi:MAG: sugar transferase [Desulfobacterales bacterium]|nr:sugar transferase [Desulfobacterales bacterium]MBF0395578.1 sugar transferase [Desulfobacterales bacterium]
MHAVIIASKRLDFRILGERYSTSMLPFLDRPFIQHIIEYLTNRGFIEFDIILSHLPQKIEAYLNNGERWGVTIRYHLEKNPERPYRALKRINLSTNDLPILLVNSEKLPDIEPEKDLGKAKKTTIIYNSNEKWLGWAWIPKDALIDLPDNCDEDILYSNLKSQKNIEIKDTNIFLSSNPLSSMIISAKSFMSNNFTKILTTSKEIEPGIWMSRNVSLHPTAQIIPPVFIGKDSRIEKKTKIGPNTVVGEHCIIENSTIISDSIIFPETYVGEGLKIDNAIVDKNLMVNVNIDSELALSEDFILGSMVKDRFKTSPAQKIIEKIAALLLLITFLPIICIVYLILKSFGKKIILKEVVILPAIDEPSLWKSNKFLCFLENPHDLGLKHIFLYFIPGLINILRGVASFVGVLPRTSEEILSLPKDWRILYIGSKVGIITESMVNFRNNITEDELYAAEAFYTSHASFLYDLKLLGRYFIRALGYL